MMQQKIVCCIINSTSLPTSFSFFLFIFYATYIFLLHHKVFYSPISFYCLFFMQHTFFYCIINSISLLFLFTFHFLCNIQFSIASSTLFISYFFLLFIFYATYNFLLHHQLYFATCNIHFSIAFYFSPISFYSSFFMQHTIFYCIINSISLVAIYTFLLHHQLYFATISFYFSFFIPLHHRRDFHFLCNIHLFSAASTLFSSTSFTFHFLCNIHFSIASSIEFI